MGRLDGKIALVTGGAGGLGLAIAKRLQAEGAKIVTSDIDGDAGRHTAGVQGFEFIQHDVTEEASWSDVMRLVEVGYKRLDVLVNNAGYLGPTDAADPENTAIEEMRHIFRINFEGTFLGCRAAIALMRKQDDGSIINMSSTAALLATPFATSYGAAKAAVRHLTRSVAQYCAEEGLRIRCNSVHPGNVRTAMWEGHVRTQARARNVAFEDIIEDTEARIPLNRLQEPEDIAAAVAFLASDDSRNITGSKIVIDGGRTECDTYSQSSRFRLAMARSPLTAS